MPKLPKVFNDLLLTLFSSLLLSALAAVFEPQPFLTAWFATSLLMWLSLFLMLRVWRRFGRGKALAALLITTFFIRVILGIFLHAALPVMGFDNPVQNSGFVYSDAHTRDTQAFTLASGNESLLSAFSRTGNSDQYGGLLFLSAVVYRTLSPEVSRPILITLLGALSMTLGLAFLFPILLQRWGRTAALVAGWFYALYPEGVLLGSSQMREPFLIGLFCISFWAVSSWQLKTTQKLIIFILATAAAALFSVPFAGMICVFLILFGLVDWLSEQTPPRNKVIGWIALSFLLAASAIAGWKWLEPTMYYDAYLTERASGTIQALIEKLGGGEWMIPFTSLSGVTQPLLPAALTYPSLPIWMTIMSVRALGWYFAIPFILYAFFAAWKVELDRKNWVMIMIAVSMAAWVCISSLRAGGDQWDNPRYRAILIPWLAVIVGWSWQRIHSGKGTWFYRWLAIEIVFLLGFTNWYLNKYHILSSYIPFFVLIALIGGISLLILLSGLITDAVTRRKTIRAMAEANARE